MDYKKHFKLNEDPFTGAADARFYCGRQGFVRVFEAVSDPSCPPLVHLKGASGVGKSALLRRLPVDLREKYKVALFLNPKLKFLEILRQALSDFGHGHKFDLKTPEEALLGFFQNTVTDYIGEGFRVLLAVDNAHELPPETLGELESLCALEEDWAGRVILFLCGQPDQPWPLSLNISVPALELDLLPMNVDEVGEYLAHRLRVAGGEARWGRRSLLLLTEYSQGKPELVNQLARRAMISAWSAGRPKVAPGHLKAARASLDKPLSPDREAAAPLRRKAPLICLALAFLAAIFFWKPAPPPAAVPAPQAEPPHNAQDTPPATATPAAENQGPFGSGAAPAPSLPAIPPQLLRLPQGSPVMVIDLDTMNGRLWQGGPRGAGLKAEIASPGFTDRGLYLFGRPHGQNTLVFQYPPSRNIPLAASRALWPRISTLLPQNMLPVIIGRGSDLSGEKNGELEEAIANRVRAWVESQQYKFVDSTAELYAATFQFFELGQEPRSMKRDDFRAALRSESSTAGDVNLTVSQPLIMRDPANSGLVWAVFHLRYESRLRRDMGARVLVFEKGVLSDAWLIAAELWLPEKSLRGD